MHQVENLLPNSKYTLTELKVPEGYEIEMAGEDQTINEAMIELLKMLGLALVFTYLIMVAQFQSLGSPFIIMFTIPLAFTGGFLGLFLTNSAISVISMIGFVMLSGIVVNNGIVLVDYVNQLRAEGTSKREALLDAGVTRMRPILMTAITTILGLVTMAMGVGMGSELMQPIAVVTIGGLTYATFMTLFIVPVLPSFSVFSRWPSGDFLSVQEYLCSQKAVPVCNILYRNREDTAAPCHQES